MTEIAFHFNAPDKVAYACRLLRKAVGRGSTLIVTGERDVLGRLDTALWTFSALEFIAHCNAASDAAMVRRSPVVLAESAHSVPGAVERPILVNLGQDVPVGFERFERLIEVVAESDAADRQSARSRWKHYAERGYAIVKHDLAAPKGDASDAKGAIA